MSARYFCDNCGEELKAGEGERVRQKLRKLAVEVMHTWDGTCNGGNICHKCILLVCNEGTDIP